MEPRNKISAMRENCVNKKPGSQKGSFCAPRESRLALIRFE